MKSANKQISRREALNKYVRAKAHREGTIFRKALDNVVSTENGMGEFLPPLLPHRRRSGWEERADRRSARISKNLHRDGSEVSFVEDNSSEAATIISCTQHQTDMTVSIFDIARPVKAKGIAKDYEIIRRVRGVVPILEEGKETIHHDDDWEKIYYHEQLDNRPSYSSILQGCD